MHAAVGEVAGRRARSLPEVERIRDGTAAVVAVRLGELVREAMLTVGKPWWTTLSRTWGRFEGEN